MAAEPISAWDARVLVGGEGTFGTVPNPAASQGLEFVGIDTGNLELGAIRAKKDRNQGRGMTNAYIQGRVAPMPFSLDISMKTRSAVDTVPNESALMKAAGFVQTVNTGVSVVYSLTGMPQSDGSLVTASIYRCTGIGQGTANSSRYLSEQLRGCIVKQVQWTGGDKELMGKFSGDGIGKYHLGYSSSITFADGSGTTLTFASAEEAYRFGIGWYQIENEIIKITTPAAVGGTTATVARAQLSTTGAAHASKPLVPYLPALTYTQAPIPETNVTVTVDSQTIRFQNFDLTFVSGIEMGPGETGSKYIQTPITKRYSLKLTCKGLMRREDVSLLGKAENQVTPIAATIVCGTGTGGIYTFSLPQLEIDPFKVPDAPNDVAYMTVPFRARDTLATGNDMLTVTLT